MVPMAPSNTMGRSARRCRNVELEGWVGMGRLWVAGGGEASRVSGGVVSGQSGLRALRGDVGATERFALPRAQQSLAERQTEDEDGRR